MGLFDRNIILDLVEDPLLDALDLHDVFNLNEIGKELNYFFLGGASLTGLAALGASLTSTEAAFIV